jgi:Cytochrome c554 and c-prime
MHERASRLLPLLPPAALFAIVFTVSIRAAAPAAIVTQTPQPTKAASEIGNYTGPGSCSAVACHGSIRAVTGSRILQTEYSTWISQDRHARATEVLSNPTSMRMGRILGIARPDQASKCLACHGLDVPPAERARNFTTEGVSCEACHGPATGWLGYHVTKDARHEESVRRGMYDTKDVVKRTEKCLTCHLGTAEKFVDHEMIAAGHPDLVFDLDAFSAAMPRHWRESSDADPFGSVRTFGVGQLVHLGAALDRLGRRVKGPVWPEYAELDCFACHHSLTRPEDSWRQAQGYERRARPGNPPLNVARYVTARRVLEAWDPSAASDLDATMTRLQIEASRLRVKEEEVATLARQARTIVDRGISRGVAATPTAESTSKLLQSLLEDAPAIAERGERAAEQTAMAVETLATALSRAKGQDPTALKRTFAELFEQFESPSSYDPRKFVAAIRKIESSLR